MFSFRSKLCVAYLQLLVRVLPTAAQSSPLISCVHIFVLPHPTTTLGLGKPIFNTKFEHGLSIRLNKYVHCVV